MEIIMRKLIIIVFLGFLVVQLAGAREEKQISVLENQPDLHVQGLVNPEGAKANDGATEKQEEKQISVLENQPDLYAKGLVNLRRGRNDNSLKKKSKRRIRKRKNKKRKSKKKTKKIKMNQTRKCKKKKCKSKNKNKMRKKRRNRNKTKKKNWKNGKDQNRVTTACANLCIGVMKALRKQYTYVKQYNKLSKAQSLIKNKLGNKDKFDSNTTDGPLKLLIEAGGGDKANMQCAGSKNNTAALLMTNLTTKLIACKGDVDSKCNITIEIKPEWTECKKIMVAFKAATDVCLKSTGEAFFACLNGTEVITLQSKVENCSAAEMNTTSNEALNKKKACKEIYGPCRKNGEEIRKVLAACSAGGPTVKETTKKLGTVLLNEDANKKILEKTKSMVSSAGRKTMKRADVTFNGVTYSLDTCSSWADAALAWIAALDNDQISDISEAGKTIAAIDVTCTASDLTKLKEVETKGNAVATKVAEKAKKLQNSLEKITGSTVSPAEAQSVAQESGSGGGTPTKAVRRRKNILGKLIQQRLRT